jgi:hypothetical protein
VLFTNPLADYELGLTLDTAAEQKTAEMKAFVKTCNGES